MRFASWTVNRLLQALVALVALTALAFLLLRSAPGDPARAVAGPRANEETIAAVRESMGLDDSMIVQYVRYLQRLARGDLGMNSSGTAHVADQVTNGVWPTLALVVCASLLVFVLAIALTIWSVQRPSGIVDRAIRTFAIGGMALPSFWVGLVLITFVALPTGWFPVGGWPADPAERMRALVLPSISLALAFGPLALRSLRSSVLGVLDTDYVAAARVMGVSRVRFWRTYVLRNAFVPSVPVFAIVVAAMLGASVVVEATFNLPGLGTLLASAALSRDVNLMQGTTLLLGIGVLVIYFAADVVVALLDPRVKVS